MCKWIKDILFPTNILGKKKKCVKVAIENPPYTDRVFNVDWQGERLNICYTSLFRRSRTTKATPVRLVYNEEEQGEQSFTVSQNSTLDRRTWTDEVYFNCTNVTKLIVNGEQLI